MAVRYLDYATQGAQGTSIARHIHTIQHKQARTRCLLSYLACLLFPSCRMMALFVSPQYFIFYGNYLFRTLFDHSLPRDHAGAALRLQQ